MRNLRLALIVCFLPLTVSAQKLTIAPGITVTVPPTWKAKQDTRTTFLVEHASGGKIADASMTIHVEKRRTHEEAVRRLAEIEVEHPGEIKYMLLAGWPALERKATVTFQYPGELPGQERQGQEKRELQEAGGTDQTRMPHGRGNETSIRVTTVAAVGEFVVRLQTLLQPDASAAVADEALSMGRTLTAPPANRAQSEEDLKQLQGGSLRPKPRSVRSHAPSTVALPTVRRERRGVGGNAGGSSVKVNGGGEIEAAASMDGQNLLTDAACSISYSNNGGSSFTASNVSFAGAPALDGDCTLAWGQSGNFYIGWLGSGAAHAPEWISLFRSTNNGANFNFVTNAVNRSAPPAINVDQPHIAADRWNASASSQDRVYVAWHETGSFVSRVACSSDSGATWGAPVAASSGNFGFPRVAVGKDGMVYVVSRSGGNIVVDKFSNCDAGLTEQAGFPATISISDVPCPVPGLDRCNNGNTLSSPTIAVDDTNPNHVYIGWAQTSGPGQDIVITDSQDGGQSFPNPLVAANGAATGVRYMPWLGAWGGTAYVGWYDRRTSNAGNNDRTRYYRGSVSAANGTLTAGAEADLMGVDDTQCASPWSCGVRAVGDCENCSTQPQLGGRCRHSPPNNTDSFQACDFSSGPACPAGESCQTASGCPKYGDYNGLAVGGGRLLNIWASGTAPSDLPPAANHNILAYTVVTDLPSDFFVRDWTNNASDHDTGVEPSTNPVFYETSDVWNQVTNTAYGPVNDWVLGDAPVRSGANYAFARISRRAPASSTSAPVTVTADFLAADFGLGVPFAPIGSQMVTMNAVDNTVVTPAVSWNVAATASTHLCLAVQISAPGDAYLMPSLSGLSPGPSDPLILADNNKAQRNLQQTVGGGGAGGESFAIIHNIEKVKRDIVIDYGVDPKSQRFVESGTIAIIGRQSQNVALQKSGRIVLQGMEPGEDRWLGLRFGKVSSELGSLVIVRFTEVLDGKPVNGFSIAYKHATKAVVARELLQEEADVMARLAAITRETSPRLKAEESARLLVGSPKEIDMARFRAVAREHHEVLRNTIQTRLALKPENDPFAVNEALGRLERALASPDDEGLLAAHQAAIQRLDAYLTWTQRKR
ncbi:MAG TPA: hypothetical protein VI636_20885 [Candidatus Angelobacter sp.]